MNNFEVEMVDRATWSGSTRAQEYEKSIQSVLILVLERGDYCDRNEHVMHLPGVIAAHVTLRLLFMETGLGANQMSKVLLTL